MNDYQCFIASKLRNQKKQRDLSQAYKHVSSQRNTNALSTLESKRAVLLSANETNKGFLNTLSNQTV